MQCLSCHSLAYPTVEHVLRTYGWLKKTGSQARWFKDVLWKCVVIRKKSYETLIKKVMLSCSSDSLLRCVSSSREIGWIPSFGRSWMVKWRPCPVHFESPHRIPCGGESRECELERIFDCKWQLCFVIFFPFISQKAQSREAKLSRVESFRRRQAKGDLYSPCLIVRLTKIRERGELPQRWRDESDEIETIWNRCFDYGTLQGTKSSVAYQLEKKAIFPTAFGWDMLVSWRVGDWKMITIETDTTCPT